LRIEAGTDDVKDAAEAEVVANDLRELAGMSFGGVSLRREISDGDTRFFDAKAGARAEPILLLRPRDICSREKANEQKCRQTTASQAQKHYFLRGT